MKKILLTNLLLLTIIFLLLVVIASGNKLTTNVSYNLNNTKSLGTAHIVSKFDAIQEVEEIVPVQVETIEEAAPIATINQVAFVGTMTGYGPDCPGCGNSVACAPYPIVTDGNIYFNDANYGTLRIVAADRSIPCGTIVRVSNVSFSEPFYAIVLDRGGAIKGTLFDLLFESEAAADIVGRQFNVQYDVQRWGW